MAIISNGTTIADAGAFSASLGSMVHIKTITASSSGTVSFVHGSSSVVFNNTYPIYCIKGIQIHPSASDELGFNGNECEIIKLLTKQSPDIQMGVDRAEQKKQGAGDQGLSYSDQRY